MEKIIQVEHLHREYKIAQREGSILKFIFSRKYKILNAVKDINFSINKGELVAFVGPNGAGKSTTIKMLSGILVPSKGTVRVLNNDPYNNRKKNAVNIGVVFGQRSQLWWDLPVCDSFELLKSMYKISDETYNNSIYLFKEYMDIEKIWSQPVRQLSLGQRMRAEIAAAFLHNPQVLFLDEPTIGLDIVAKRQIREFIVKLNQIFKTTVILTSHDMKDIEEICQRIIIIDKGEIVIDCHIEELKTDNIKKETISVEFNDVVENINIKDVISVKSNSGIKWSLSFDKTLISNGDLISHLSTLGKVSQISIKEQSIEDIVYNIYKKDK